MAAHHNQLSAIILHTVTNSHLSFIYDCFKQTNVHDIVCKLRCTITLFVVLNPIGTAPFFCYYTKYEEPLVYNFAPHIRDGEIAF